MVDVDDGYTRIANELLDELILTDLTKREMKIILTIIRKTYGWNKKSDRIALSQFEKATGVQKNHTSTTLRDLVNRNIVLKQDYEFSLNKQVSEWERSPKTGLDSQNRTSPKTGQESSPKMGQGKSQNGIYPSPKTGTTKDIITKDTNTKDNNKRQGAEFLIPDFIDQDLWNDFLVHRKKLKTPNTDRALNTLVNKITKLVNQGHDANELLETAYEHGWKTVYPPKNNIQRIPVSQDQAKANRTKENLANWLAKEASQ